MEQSFSPSLDAGRWRRAALVSAAVAALELVALVIAAVALFGGPLAHRLQAAAAPQRATAEPPRPSPRTPASAKPTLARSETSVLVLNANGRQGAAASAAEIVRARGYVVGGVGNAPTRSSMRTMVMYRPGYAPEARRLARDLHIRLVGPLDGLRARDLLGAHVALILGT